MTLSYRIWVISIPWTWLISNLHFQVDKVRRRESIFCLNLHGTNLCPIESETSILLRWGNRGLHSWVYTTCKYLWETNVVDHESWRAPLGSTADDTAHLKSAFQVDNISMDLQWTSLCPIESEYLWEMNVVNHEPFFWEEPLLKGLSNLPNQ